MPKNCSSMRDAYVAEFEDESSDDDDGWVGLEMDIHHVGIPKMEEKEVQKEEGQESLKLPLDTPTLPLECAHGVEMENPLLKLMSVLSLVNEIYYSEEKHIIHIEDVVHKNQRPYEEADNVSNGQMDCQMNGKVMDREWNEGEELSKCKREVRKKTRWRINNISQDKRQQGKEEQHEVRAQGRVETLVTSILPRKCIHEAREDYSFLIDQSVMLIGNSHTFEEDNCQQMEDLHANADIMVEFCQKDFKANVKRGCQNSQATLQRQGPKDDSSITEEIEDDDVHIGIDKASQILKDAEYDSDSNSNFNLDSVSILDLDSAAILDAKTNSDANFNGTCGKLDEESKSEGVDRTLMYKGNEEEYPKCQWMLQKANDIAANDEVIFGNAHGAEFCHGNCQAIFQVGNQADDVNVEVEDVHQNADLMSKYAQHAKQILEKKFFAVEDFCQNLQRSELMMYDVLGTQHNQRSVD
ncbi:hypothetical protein L7F22_002139 [Adiantum nelumboides]|nr:hypothetical protein [Adiantum nelumboides]